MRPAWHPRVKPEHGLRRTPDNRIRIGGAVYGVAAEVIDRTGAVWTMLDSADGTRSAEQIVDVVLREHPAERAGAVHAALEKFATAGYLEDAAAADPESLTAGEKQRYDRSMRFFRWIDLQPRDTAWEPQLRLKRSSVLLIGLGGTGGVAGLSLAATGVGRLHCVDRDTVELSNLNRQVTYTELDIGRSKVDACIQRLRGLNSDIAVTGEQATIRDQGDIRRLLAGHDLLVLCADRPGEIRAWANRACLDTGTPWVDAGYHGPQVTATAYVPGQGPCYECNWMAEFDVHHAINPDRAYTVERGSVDAVTAASAGLSGYLAAHLATTLITGAGPVQPGVVVGLNLAAADHQVLIRNERHPRCPACGGGP
jgi:molybdopterin/thiamine biosynthesis adenylyltransferase